MLNRIYGGGLKLKSDLLQYATRKQILARMLHNLKNIYVDSKDFLKALSVVDMLLIIDPSDMSELRDRGLIYYKLECFVQALADLETYLRHAPQAVDRDVIGHCIMIIKELVERIN
jgi:regulator of sirC expression with transglutaminase-like and TPR domain